MISTRNLAPLPDIDALRRLLQSLAVLDAILMPERESRYFTFDAGWAAGERVGWMRNGSGDDFVAHFGPAGCWLKGFAHESPMSPYREHPPRPWPGALDAVPEAFADCLREPAFEAETATFCLWRRPGDPLWQTGPVAFPPGEPDPDGSQALLDGRPASYRDWAAEYYGREVDLTAVEHVYRHWPLESQVLERLDPRMRLGDLTTELREIGYPPCDPPPRRR